MARQVYRRRQSVSFDKDGGHTSMNHNGLNWIAGLVWSIADDVLQNVYVRGKYRAG